MCICNRLCERETEKQTQLMTYSLLFFHCIITADIENPDYLFIHAYIYTAIQMLGVSKVFHIFKLGFLCWGQKYRNKI